MRKQALGTRAPMSIPQDQNLRWSLDFGGLTTTPTDRTRASTGSRQPSLQPAHSGAEPEQTLLINEGKPGEQVSQWGTRDAIKRDGMEVDAPSLDY